MSDTQQQLDSLSREDLLKIVQRDNFVKDQLSARVAALMRENLELIALIQDQQQNTPDPTNNGEVVTAPLEPDAVIS